MLFVPLSQLICVRVSIVDSVHSIKVLEQILKAHRVCCGCRKRLARRHNLACCGVRNVVGGVDWQLLNDLLQVQYSWTLHLYCSVKLLNDIAHTK